jgi:hypothetical protein
MHQKGNNVRRNGDRIGKMPPSRPRFPGAGGKILLSSTALAGLTLAAPEARAMSLYNAPAGNSNLEINLDLTAEYSTFLRVNAPSKVLTTFANGNDGDLDFQHGIVSNEFDLLPVFDIKYGNYGAHFSAETYLNTSYLGKDQNDSPATFNPFTPASNQDFTSATRNVNGENFKWLDAFAYGSQYFGPDDQQELTVKVGRQTLLWGQSLFFAGNGIAGGQAPFDIIKAESLPNAQTQQFILPVGQVVVTYQSNEILTLQAYYQFEWEHDQFQGVGSYFSNGIVGDGFDKGGQRLIAGNFFGQNLYLYRTNDITPPAENGQFGASVQATLGNYDLGLYALRFDSKLPELYVGPPTSTQGGPINVGSYTAVYPRDIQLYGTSLSTTVGDVNVGGEVSGRRNMPLDSGAAFTVYPGPANNGALYAVGNTLAAQISAIYVSPGVPLDPGGVAFAGEFAMNHVLEVTANKAMLYPGRNNTAGAAEFVITPAYFELLPNTELQFPIGLTYDIFNRSKIDATMNRGTGAVSIGVTATYRVTWTAGLTYNDYFGKPDPVINPNADRGYLSFNIEHTF